jgi:hypothetical protein
LTPTRESDVFRQILRAGNYARSQGRGQAEILFLVELRILKCCEALDGIENDGGEPRFLDLNARA